MAPPAWPEEYSEEAGVSVLPPAPQEKQKEYIPAEPVQMNAWLEAAEKIHLDPASQPLVTSAELESFDGQNMKLTVDLEKLTAHDMVAKLAAWERCPRHSDDGTLEIPESSYALRSEIFSRKAEKALRAEERQKNSFFHEGL